MYNGREPQSAFSRFFVLPLHHLPFHSPPFFTRIFFVMSVQNYKNAKSQKCKNAKTQKGAKSIFQIYKENAHILQRKRRRQTENRGCTLCANVPKYTPKGKMGHPKWQNGIPQMVKWDTPKGKMGYPKRQNGISQMVKWDTPNGKMGHPKW